METNKLQIPPLRCKACNILMSARMRPSYLPDGSVDELCTHCKGAISASSNVRYKDYQFFEELYQQDIDFGSKGADFD